MLQSTLAGEFSDLQCLMNTLHCLSDARLLLLKMCCTIVVLISDCIILPGTLRRETWMDEHLKCTSVSTCN